MLPRSPIFLFSFDEENISILSDPLVIDGNLLPGAVVFLKSR